MPERDRLGCTIDVASNCAAWSEIYPAAEELARDAAQLALVRGSAVLKIALRERVELGVLLTGAAEQRCLNRNYRGVDAPTNVLAFPAWEPAEAIPAGAPILLGDVALALETVAREASEQDKPIADHFRHLVVHGVLHLLGFDHSTPAEAEAMEALERSILAELGVPDPYREPISLNESTSLQP